MIQCEQFGLEFRSTWHSFLTFFLRLKWRGQWTNWTCAYFEIIALKVGPQNQLWLLKLLGFLFIQLCGYVYNVLKKSLKFWSQPWVSCFSLYFLWKKNSKKNLLCPLYFYLCRSLFDLDYILKSSLIFFFFLQFRTHFVGCVCVCR